MQSPRPSAPSTPATPPASPLHPGARAVERALSQWREDIREPSGRVTSGPILERYIREGLGWTWIKDYENRAFEWCGAFAAWAWLDGLSAQVRKKHLASTYRLREWARGTAREVGGLSAARPGDIAITGPRKAWGDHITLIERVELDGSGAWTIEGNARGEGPAPGPKIEGVIRRFRSAEEIRFIYRPLAEDAERGH